MDNQYREKAVRALVLEDMHDILSGQMNDYLEDILTMGVVGYGGFTDKQLEQELTDREIEL